MTICPFCTGTRLGAWRRAPRLYLLCYFCGVAIRADALCSGVPDQDYHARDEDATTPSETPYSLLHGFAHRYILPALGDGALLDYGTGTGSLLKILSEAGAPVYGVERSPTARKSALERYGILLAASFEDLPTATTLTVASAFEVIEHIPDLHWLKRIFGILPSGASIFITTPNRDSLAALIGGKQWPQLVNPYHIALFNSVALKNVLEIVGFRKVRVIRYGPVLGRNRLFSAGHRALLMLNRHSVLRMSAVKP